MLRVRRIAIDPAQIKGVLPLPLARLRAGLPVLGNPTDLHEAVDLTAKEFGFGFGNAVSEEESAARYEQWTIPSPTRPLFQAGAVNFALHSQAKINTSNDARDRVGSRVGPLRTLRAGTVDQQKATTLAHELAP